MPKFWMIFFIALVAILFTIPFLVIWIDLTALIWDSEFVTSNHWVVPVLVILFSVLVGLCVKYLKAETAIHGSISESVESGAVETEYKKFPGSLASAYLSLISGASIGPEGALGALVRQITSWFLKLLKVKSKEGGLAMSVAALASAYNGIIGQPLFTSVFAVELLPNKKNALELMAWTLMAGVIGFLIYAGLGFVAFLGQVPMPPLEGDELYYIVEAIILGVLGGFLALFMGACFIFFGKVMGCFDNRVVLRIFLASLVIAAVAYFLPELMFSGEAVDAQRALDMMEVDALGLDDVDRKILSTIIENFGGGPVGIGTIAATIDEEKDTIESIYEPFLMRIGFLDRTIRGRVITPKAYAHLGYECREPGSRGRAAKPSGQRKLFKD
jgi:H+/Cl- antiporter ClcA